MEERLLTGIGHKNPPRECGDYCFDFLGSEIDFKKSFPKLVVVSERLCLGDIGMKGVYAVRVKPTLLVVKIVGKCPNCKPYGFFHQDRPGGWECVAKIDCPIYKHP